MRIYQIDKSFNYNEGFVQETSKDRFTLYKDGVPYVSDIHRSSFDSLCNSFVYDDEIELPESIPCSIVAGAGVTIDMRSGYSTSYVGRWTV